MYVGTYSTRLLLDGGQVEDALQVFTLVILEARLVTRDAIRRITEYKVVTASIMYRLQYRPLR